MFDCYINLCAFVYSLQQPGYPYIISKDNSKYIPLKYKISNEDKSLKDCIYNLIDSIVDINPKSINTFLMEAVLQENEIHMFYVCVLPIDSKILSGYKIPAQLLLHVPLLNKALKYV